MGPARLLLPALRWNARTGFDHESAVVEAALRRGAGGFALFGGEPDAVRQLTYTTQSRCDYPLLFASDLERGAGQQFTGRTQMPPAGALGFVDDAAVTARAARTTALEAHALGVNWILAPVADVDTEPRNPIVGTRSFGTRSAHVARHVAAWVSGCRSTGVLCCAKHFPGHGRTVEDSHSALPRVAADRHSLEDDLEPFRAAIAAGVDSIMTAHVVFEALDSDSPATLSPAILGPLLRTALGFDGIIVTDALNMQGVLDAAGGDARHAAIRALNAGCDAILYPAAFSEIADALDAELNRSLSARRVSESLARVRDAAERAAYSSPAHDDHEDVAESALGTAVRAVSSLRDRIDLPRAFDLIILDDDLGGPFPSPSRNSFVDALRDSGFDVRATVVASSDRAAVIAVYSDIRAWKGEPVISENARASVNAVLAQRPDAVIVLFGHPRLERFLQGRRLLCAWGGESLMQRAAARWLALASGRAMPQKAGLQ
ncbi:MAG TPA: glycoside hydrolase family 3 N-terminal domain-containing protein [Longimicrobiales bacterium]